MKCPYILKCKDKVNWCEDSYNQKCINIPDFRLATLEAELAALRAKFTPCDRANILCACCPRKEAEK